MERARLAPMTTWTILLPRLAQVMALDARQFAAALPQERSTERSGAVCCATPLSPWAIPITATRLRFLLRPSRWNRKR